MAVLPPVPCMGPRAGCCRGCGRQGRFPRGCSFQGTFQFLGHQGGQAGIHAWPISDGLMSTVTVPSGVMRMKALGAKASPSGVGMTAWRRGPSEVEAQGRPTRGPGRP